MRKWRESLTRLLFPPEQDLWLAILRTGLGITVIAYCISIGRNWTYLLAGTGQGLISRQLSEALLSMESPFIPGVSWIVDLGRIFGLGERQTLVSIWAILLLAGLCLVVGLVSRAAAITAWFLQLCAAKSSTLLSYGVDNFITIGLFYVMLAPPTTSYSLDNWLWRMEKPDSRVLGFFRRVLQIHLCIIYFFGGLTKSLGQGWWNGTSLWRALTRPPFDLLDGAWLVQWKMWLAPLGIAIWLFELSYPFFIWHTKTRPIWLSLICVMHLMIGLGMGMYLFALIMIVLNLAAFGPFTPSIRERNAICRA